MLYNSKAKIIIIISCLVLAAALFPIAYGQSRYLSLGVAESNIVSFEIVEYESEPFASAIISRNLYNEQAALSLQNMFSREDIAYIPGENSNKMIFITYEDGQIINGYVNDDKMGLDYGRIWLNISLDEII